jgi:hypothetical protein
MKLFAKNSVKLICRHPTYVGSSSSSLADVLLPKVLSLGSVLFRIVTVEAAYRR